MVLLHGQAAEGLDSVVRLQRTGVDTTATTTQVHLAAPEFYLPWISGDYFKPLTVKVSATCTRLVLMDTPAKAPMAAR